MGESVIDTSFFKKVMGTIALCQVMKWSDVRIMVFGSSVNLYGYPRIARPFAKATCLFGLPNLINILVNNRACPKHSKYYS